jgi:Uracil DNA glycosylase superfamily
MPTKREVLPDYLARYQRVVFVGTAAGNASASFGHYYASPGNAFWELLYSAGLTTSSLEPREDAWVLVDRIGLTDLCKHHHGMDITLSTDGHDIGSFVGGRSRSTRLTGSPSRARPLPGPPRSSWSVPQIRCTLGRKPTGRSVAAECSFCPAQVERIVGGLAWRARRAGLSGMQSSASTCGRRQ